MELHYYLRRSPCLLAAVIVLSSLVLSSGLTYAHARTCNSAHSCASDRGTATASALRRLFIKARSNGSVVTIGGFHPSRNPSVDAAINVFDLPDASATHYGGTACTMRWNELGLTIQFADFSGSNDACNSGFAQFAVVKKRGRETHRWSTPNGLRLGDSVARLRRLHPNATRHGASWWLVTSRSHIGVGCGTAAGCAYPVLRAKTTRGHVTSFRLSIGAAGD